MILLRKEALSRSQLGMPGLVGGGGHTQRAQHYSQGASRARQRLIYKVKGSPYSITERRVPELIPVLGSQSTSDVSYKPGGRLPLLSARPAVTPATLKRAATSFAAW